MARAGDLTLDTNTVVDLGLDSLERLHIANSLEEIFGGRFPDEELQRIETCREVAEAVEKYIGAEPKNAPDLFTIGGEIKQDGGKREIPASHYEFSRMPEFIRFEQSRRELQDTGLQNPYFLSQDGVFGPAMTLNGKEIINFASHDYLGLAADSRLHECAKHAIDQYGTSVSASRLASGERPLYQDLEQALAETLDCEATAVFVSGYGANETTIGHLLGRGDLIVHDARTNRRLVKGAELSGARRLTFAHNQWEEINDLLRNERQNFRRVLIAVEGMCTVDGDFPDLPKLIELKHRYKTLLLVDQAHSLGTIGPCGRGLAEYYGVPAADVDVWTGSFSYALGSSGGYIAGSRKLVDYLKHTSPGFIFASGASPACVAAANAALQILKEEPEHIATLQANSQLFLQLAKQGNLDTGTSSETPIIPIIVGNSFDVLTVSERLIEQGFRAHDRRSSHRGRIERPTVFLFNRAALGFANSFGGRGRARAT